MTIITQKYQLSNKMSALYVKISSGDNMSGKTNNFLQILKAIGILILSNILVYFIFGITFLMTKKSDISYLISYIVATISLIIFNYKYLKIDFKNIKSDYKKVIINVLIFTIIFTILVNVSNYILFNLSGHLANKESLNEELVLSSPLLMFITIGIIAPIFEELSLRYPYRNISINKYIKLIITTILFVLLHLTSMKDIYDILYIISYIFLNLEFAYSYFKSNNIYGSIIVHLLNNSIIILILLLGSA